MWELDYKESWALKSWCFWTVVLEKTLESPLDCKEIQPVHPKGDQSWVFIGKTDVEAERNSNTLAPWCEGLTYLKRPWCWERLRAGEEGDNRGWDGWMASLTRWTWVWVDSGSWWWTGRPGVLRFMGSQRVGHGWATELNWCSAIVQICFLKLWRLNTPVKSSINCKWQRGLTAITLLGQERPREREWVLRFPSCGRDTGRKKCSDLYKENNHSASTLLSTEVRMPAVLDEVMSQEGDSLGDDILVIYC